MKPTLKKYWEANSSGERSEIVEAAFQELEELRSKDQKLNEILKIVQSTNRRVAMSL